ncbi:MAG: aldehyde dehydrogenase family protein [Actinomycetota bacterium]
MTAPTYTKRDPFRIDVVTGEYPSAGADAVVAAVEAAAHAFPSWSALPLQQRAGYLTGAAALLEQRLETVAAAMTAEMGKPIREARGETLRAAQILRYAASFAFRAVGQEFEQAGGGSVSVLRRPLGVVGLITPWNFPIAIPAWKLAPALMLGNTVVLKLAYDAPGTGLHLAAALADAGLPAGVLEVLTGRGAVVGDALTRDDRVRAVSFTGSVATGAAVREAVTGRGARAQLELGGQNPLLVMADADLDRAVTAAFAGAFWSAGQKCTATRRIYVEHAVYDDFKTRFLARVAAGKVGDPTDPETDVGPLVNEAQFDEVLGGIERGRDEGGTVLAGGAATGQGYVVEPTVFEDVADDAFLSCNEVFGPVTALYPVRDFDDAIERANATEFGLSAGIFTSSLATTLRFRREAQAGLLHVNSQTAGADVHVPFGGIKGSGFGPHEQGEAALEFFGETVTVYVDA